MRRAQTYPIQPTAQSQLYSRQGFQALPSRPRLLALPPSESIGVRQEPQNVTPNIWQNIFNRAQENREAQEYREPSPTLPERNTSILDEPVQEHIEDYPTDDSLTSPNDNAQMLRFSERLDEYMKGHLLLRDLLDPHHTTSMLRIFFSLIIGVMMCIVFALIYSALNEDLANKRADEYQAYLLIANQCAEDYLANRCEPENRIEHLKDYCLEKERCMNQNPSNLVSSLKMTASLLGETLNEFVNPLSYKTMAFFLVLIFGVIFVFNCTFMSHPPRQEFKRTPEYNELHSRLQTIERLNCGPRTYAIRNGSATKEKMM